MGQVHLWSVPLPRVALGGRVVAGGGWVWVKPLLIICCHPRGQEAELNDADTDASISGAL